MKKILSTAAIALVGAVMTGCSSDDNLASEQQLQKQDNIVTVTTTIGLSGDNATTRALAINYTDKKLVKTFAVGDQMGLTYQQNGGSAYVVSNPLTAGDISADGKSAKLTFMLTNPIENGSITCKYPASMLDANGSIDNSFFLSQNGTLDDVAMRDLTRCDDHLAGTNLPASMTLENQLAVVGFTLKDADGTNDITSNITNMTISDGTNDYTISGHDTDGHIYVAMMPTSSATINITATDGTKNYTKTLTDKTYAANDFYQQGLRMAEDATTPQLGYLYYSDGTYSATLLAGKTPIGVIAYLDQEGTDDDEITEKSHGGGHGLVLCLKNAAIEVKWSTNTSSQAYTGNAFVTDVAGLTRTTGVSGYSATNALASDATTYPAAAAAKSYTGLTAPAGTTGWFLPSAQQWVKMQTGLGGLSESSIVWNSWFDNSHTAADKWEAALSKAGYGNYDSITRYQYYLSSSEYSALNAVTLGIDGRSTGTGYGFLWYISTKNLSNNTYVRPVLAF